MPLKCIVWQILIYHSDRLATTFWDASGREFHQQRQIFTNTIQHQPFKHETKASKKYYIIILLVNWRKWQNRKMTPQPEVCMYDNFSTQLTTEARWDFCVFWGNTENLTSKINTACTLNILITCQHTYTSIFLNNVQKWQFCSKSVYAS